MLNSMDSREILRHSLRRSVIALCLLAVSMAHAQPEGLRSQLAESAGPGHQSARQVADKDTQPAPNVAPAEAARRASSEYGGRVLNVVLEHGPGGPYYRVKLLDGGRVRVVHVEARH